MIKDSLRQDLIENLAAEVKNLYSSTPKTRGMDSLEGWREIATYVVDNFYPCETIKILGGKSDGSMVNEYDDEDLKEGE